jgi:hypothetical protein
MSLVKNIKCSPPFAAKNLINFLNFFRTAELVLKRADRALLVLYGGSRHSNTTSGTCTNQTDELQNHIEFDDCACLGATLYV